MPEGRPLDPEDYGYWFCPQHSLYQRCEEDCPGCSAGDDWGPDDVVNLGPGWEPDQGLGLDIAGEVLPAWMWYRSPN